MRRHLTKFTLVLGITCLLGACGFQLRGTGGGGAVLPDDWKSMYLVTGNPNAEFSRAVQSVLSTNDLSSTSRADANYALILGPERFNQTNLSLNSEARVSQYELSMQTNFSVLGADGKEVMPNTIASVTRQMENDPRNAMGKSEEVRILKGEMRTELAQQIVRRIGFFAASNP